jgi:hypothetical protein
MCCFGSENNRKRYQNPIQKQLQELVVKKAVTIKQIQIRTFAEKKHGDLHGHSFAKVLHAVNKCTKSEGTVLHGQSATIFSYHRGHDQVLFNSMDTILLNGSSGQVSK